MFNQDGKHLLFKLKTPRCANELANMTCAVLRGPFPGKICSRYTAHTKPTNASPHRPEPRSVPSTQLLSHLRGGACRGRKVGPEPMGAA